MDATTDPAALGGQTASIALGERALAWRSTLGSSVSAIIADTVNLPAALFHAVEQRKLGNPFFAAPFIDDLPTAYVRRCALASLASGNLQSQEAALVQLALQARTPAVVAATPELRLDPGTIRTLHDFVIAGDGVLVRSLAEMHRLRALLPTAVLGRLTVLTGPATIALPATGEASQRDMVLVWAPHLDAQSLGLETFALAVSGRPAAIICRGGTLNGIDVAFAQVADAERFLVRAKVVIVADSCDPAPAVAFAAAGYSVIAAAASGAIEQIDGLIEYDPCDVVALKAAIAAAWTTPAPVLRTPREPASDVRYIIGEDNRCTTARKLAATAWHLQQTYDLRRDAFDRIAGFGGRLPRQAATDLETAADRLAAEVPLHFESWRDVARARESFGLRLKRIVVRPELDTRVPRTLLAARERDTVVVWAPSAAAEDLATICMGLHYEKRPIVLVCNGGQLPGSRATIVGLEAAQRVLSRAAVCVDADTQSPAAALALAQLGIPLAVASTSGADEYLDYVTVYDPWDHGSIFTAVAIAKASPPPLVPRRIGAAELPARLGMYAGDVAEDGPLVSVVLLTRNRRNLLTRALASIARQRYRNIETIVVRNGGVRIDDLVDAVRGARVIDSEVNLGVVGGTNLGTLAARGKYIAYLADDDEYLPDHIGSAVAALQRTGSSFAHGGMIAVHLSSDGAGGYDDHGCGIACERPAEPGFMRAMNSVATPAMLIDRELLARTGNWNEEFGPMTDYELVIRFMLLDELVYVNRPVVIQTYRRDGTQYSATMNPDMPRILKSVYARHPLGDEPWAARKRAEWIANFERHQASGSVTPLWYPHPTVTYPPRPYSAADVAIEPAPSLS